MSFLYAQTIKTGCGRCFASCGGPGDREDKRINGFINGGKPSKFNLPDYPLALGSLGGDVRPP